MTLFQGKVLEHPIRFPSMESYAEWNGWKLGFIYWYFSTSHCHQTLGSEQEDKTTSHIIQPLLKTLVASPFSLGHSLMG